MKQNNLELKLLIIIFKNEKNINIVFLLSNNKNIKIIKIILFLLLFINTYILLKK